MKENKKYFILAGEFLVVFIIFTILVKIIDVQPIGPQGSEVGFASINKMVADIFGYNETFYKISEVLGYVAIGTAIIFVLFGAMQLYYKKGPKNVDKDLYAIGGMYVMCLIVYVLFEKIIINYRPVILEEGLEASYPSSHTLLAVAFVSAAVAEFEVRLKDGAVKKVILLVCMLDCLGVVTTRLLSGVHWVTDIIGALLIASACYVAFYGVLMMVVESKKKSKEDQRNEEK